jgi:hypothetical protein
MNRIGAVALLKVLFENCPALEGKPFALMPPAADSVLSKDHQIHIKSSLDETTLRYVKKIVKNYPNYALYETLGLVVIYESAQKRLAAQAR